jgi:hypothetical protein
MTILSLAGARVAKAGDRVTEGGPAEGVEAAIAALVPDAFPGDAHGFLMLVYKDPRNDLKIRLEAAKLAIRFEKQELAAGAADPVPVRIISAEPLSEEEWARVHGRDLAAPAGTAEGADRLPFA